MENDLPIYSDSMLRTRLQFSDLELVKGRDFSPLWSKADACIELMEAASNAAAARKAADPPSKETIIEVHRILFEGRDGAGLLRTRSIPPIFRGQDCPDPEFIDRSLYNFSNWLTAESFREIHPIEKAALVLTRIVDIWPFEFGNLTVGLVIANEFLRQAELAPFFVLPEHMKEFNTVIGQAVAIETQPLVNAMHRTLKREMEASDPR